MPLKESFNIDFDLNREDLCLCLQQLDIDSERAAEISKSIPDNIMEQISVSLSDNIEFYETLGSTIEKRFPEILKPHRYCSQCNEIMTEGFVIENGDSYYCSEQCLHKNMTPKEYSNLYDNGNGDSFWTTWE